MEEKKEEEEEKEEGEEKEKEEGGGGSCWKQTRWKTTLSVTDSHQRNVLQLSLKETSSCWRSSDSVFVCLSPERQNLSWFHLLPVACF